jgi:site-specific DNA recombinase
MNDSTSIHFTALYARKSRRHESESTSCETQVDTCTLYALSQGWKNCVAFVDDGKSGETLERPALKQLLESLRRGEVKRIVMTSLDRLTRKLAHLVNLLDKLAQAEVVLAVVDFPEFNNSPTGRLMASIIGAANEFQIELTKERLADARAALKRQGKRVAGRVAFG